MLFLCSQIPDFSRYYNSTLTKNEQLLFEYDKKLSNYDINYDDMFDYDIRGAWRDLVLSKEKNSRFNHLSDKFKKPNHPTFSDESIYESTNNFFGGHWFSKKNGTYIFVPGLTNFYSHQDLDRYFLKREPNNELCDLRESFFSYIKIHSFNFSIINNILYEYHSYIFRHISNNSIYP